MKNNQLLPFERNRYYSGKMLTSADFMAEQLYMNNKRRFLNSVMNGAGVVCGLSVFSLDDLSILVESGVALDDYGREIVIDSSVVKKLSAIDGFDTITGNTAYLAIKYKEDEVHSVYSVGHQENKGSEYEFNRIAENYSLFLIDEGSLEEDFALEDEFLTGTTLFANDDFKISITIPSLIPKGKKVKAVLKCEKLSESDARISYSSVLQIPVLTSLKDEHEVTLELADISLPNGQYIEREIWLCAQETEIEGAEIVVKAGSTHALINGSEVHTQNNSTIKVSIIDLPTEDLITHQLAKLSLEMRNSFGQKDYVILAKLNLVRTESAYLIEKVVEEKIKKYIATPGQYSKRAEYLSYFNANAVVGSKGSKKNSQDPVESLIENAGGRYPIATGTLEIPIGDKVKKGEIRYSGEIMHGLGKGNVYVQIGLENLEEDQGLGTSAKSTIFGKVELFDNMPEALSGIETAVKVLNDKGSFIAAARFTKDPEFLMLTYRWVAIKFPQASDLEIPTDNGSRSIVAETPTVVLGTKDSYFFNVKFVNMESCSIDYELTEEGSGEITAEGMYTAPSKEGVYEIRIFCTDMPFICTYAYAIVKKKGIEKEDEDK